MKKICLSFALLIITVTVFCQHPIGNDSLALQTLGNSKTLVKSKGAIGSDSGFVNAVYPDTASANLGKLKNYPGAQIRVVDTIFVRNSTATKWLNISVSTGGGSGVTSVAKGWGILQDGTITTTGTITLDSILLDERYANGDINFIVDFGVLDSLNTPPGSPSEGDKYLVGTVATGDFAGEENNIATYTGGTWAGNFQTPSSGQLLINANNGIISKWTGTAWIRVSKYKISLGGDALGIPINIGPLDNKGSNLITNGISRYSISNNGVHRFLSLNGTGKELMALSSNGTASRAAWAEVADSVDNYLSSGTWDAVMTNNPDLLSDYTSNFHSHVWNIDSVRTLNVTSGYEDVDYWSIGNLTIDYDLTRLFHTSFNNDEIVSKPTYDNQIQLTDDNGIMLYSSRTLFDAPQWIKFNSLQLDSSGLSYKYNPDWESAGINTTRTESFRLGFDGTISLAEAPATYSSGGFDAMVRNQTTGSIELTTISGGGGGVTTLAAIGASPNANAATISGVTLNLEPASDLFGGVVTTGTQIFGGNKTLNGTLTLPGVTIGSSLDSFLTIRDFLVHKMPVQALSPWARGPLPSASATLNVIYPRTQTDSVFVGITGDLLVNAPQALFNVNGTARFSGFVSTGGALETGNTIVSGNRLTLGGITDNALYNFQLPAPGTGTNNDAHSIHMVQNYGSTSVTGAVGIYIGHNLVNTGPTNMDFTAYVNAASPTSTGTIGYLTGYKNEHVFATNNNANNINKVTGFINKTSGSVGGTHKIVDYVAFQDSVFTGSVPKIAGTYYSVKLDSISSDIYAGSTGGAYHFWERANAANTIKNRFESATNEFPNLPNGTAGTDSLVVKSGGVLKAISPTYYGAAGGATTLAALTDVNLTSLATNDFLKWDGTDWINRTPTNVKTDLGLVIGTNVQAYDADLTTYAGITPSANVQTLLAAADYAAFKTSLSLNNVDNTSDATKNSATVTLTNKTLTSPVINTPTGIVKGDVGLGNVDNTSNATERAATATLTNKRITARVTTIASSATPTPDADASDMFTVTALAAGATFAVPSGTPTDAQRLLIRIKDNATAQSLAWNAIYRAGTDVAMPSSTTISKTLYILFIYNAADSKWDLLAVTNGY